jgi:hypothetical protein
MSSNRFQRELHWLDGIPVFLVRGK